MLTEEVRQKRKNYVTSTEVSALFGVSKYKTPFQLWHEKKGDLEESFESNERMEMGLALERVIAELACKKLGLDTPLENNDFMVANEHRIAASFDFLTLMDGTQIDIECKNVDSLVLKNEWVVEGGEIIECPLHIELQLQQQMLLRGHDKQILAVLAGGNNLLVKIVEADKKVQAAIVEKVREFWAQTEAPGPDYEADMAVIDRLYTRVEQNPPIDANDDVDELLNRYYELGTEASVLEKKRKILKAEILTKIDNAAKVYGDGVTLTRTPVAPAEISYTRKGYSLFRVTKKKAK